MKYVIGRMRVEKAGFRARLSAGHYIYRSDNPKIPIAGPFGSRRDAKIAEKRMIMDAENTPESKPQE